MDAACEASSIEGVTFHTLRHTYGSNARMAGMPLEVLKDQLEHKDLRMIIRYAHIGASHQQQ
jgi:integrase